MTDLSLVYSTPSRRTLGEPCLDAFQKENDYICRTLRRLGTPQSDVADLAQEVFLTLRRRWDQYDPGRSLRPYLFGIAFRLASTHQRTLRRRREVSVGMHVVDLADRRRAPDHAIEAAQARALVLATLDRLSLTRRAVFVMHELDEIPMREVASVLELTLFAAYGRLREARREFESSIRGMLKTIDQP